MPCCFVLVGDIVYSAVDAKPKSTLALQRLRNIAARPAGSLAVDHYDEDWSQLWWIRLDGPARVVEPGPEHDAAIEALTAKYAQYVDAWRAWP